jgi:nitrogen-specific signal transduction histidine kinase/ActR/RegA family two-component response regulator
VMLLSIFGLIAIRWRRQVHRVLEAAHQQAQRGNEAKQRFLAIMSHEIRTPLNGIVGTVSMLGQRNLAPQEQQQLLQLLSNSSDMLVSLLSDVLDWAKLEAGHVDVTRGPVRLRALLVDSVEMFASVAFDKGLELTYSHEAGLPEVLMGDEMHLRQALNNLVSNAVKFTRQGGVHVHMGTEVAEDALPEPGGARVHVRIEVQDSGIGMTTAQLSGLFQPFAQVDQSTTRQYGGTGLGLSISRELARRMGGDIVVSSRPGVGSCFVIRVPLGAEGVPEPLGGQALPSGLAGRRLCLVSRSAGLRRQVGALAHDLGLVLAPDGAPPAEADAVLVDAAVLQARADGADGMASVAPWSWGTSGQSRAVLSAIAQAHDLDLPPGVLHLYQPLRASALADWLTGTSWFGAAQDLPASSASDEALPELHVLVAEDHELNRMLLGEMLEHCQAHVELVETGRAAVEAVKARHFDLLLVDYQMPGMDGLSAARLIRQHERAQGLEPMPIVLISGDVNVEAQGVWQEAGVNRVLGKPFVFGDMVALIDEVRRALPPRSVQAQ